MKRLKLIGIGLALGLFLVVVGVGLYLWQARSSGGFDVEGRVAGFSNDARTIIVEHERIPGYMEAMTMPFTAKDSTELRGLEVGDAIGFHLNLAQDSSWITDVEKLPDSAVVEHPAAATSPNYTRTSEAPALEAGDAVPDFTLAKNQHGEPVHRSDFEGQTLVLTFIYTRCPIPDYCPLMSRNFAQLQEQLPAELEGDVHLLSISFDPKNDTPQVLRDYAARYTDDFSNWTFATGTEAQVQRVTDLFGVFTQQEGGQIVHSLRTVLIGPDGKVRKVWRGNEWQPVHVLEAVQQVLGQEEA